MKRTIAIAALCAGIMLTTFPCQAKESGNLKINAKNFPDTIVREYVAEKIDKNNDGYLSKKEISAVKTIIIDKNNLYWENKEKPKEDYEIIDCKGLEIFTNVEKVKLTTYCDTYVSEYGNIKNIKVLTKLTKIKNLEISGVNNSNYDFTKLNNLERLCIKSTKLKKLNLSKNVKLKNLKLAYNPLLKKINLTKNKNLEKINLYGSGVKKFTLGKNNKIKNANLNCTFISNYEKCNFNPKILKTLKICNTQIKKVNLKKYKNLKKLSVTKEVKVIGYKGKKTIYDETL